MISVSQCEYWRENKPLLPRARVGRDLYPHFSAPGFQLLINLVPGMFLENNPLPDSQKRIAVGQKDVPRQMPLL